MFFFFFFTCWPGASDYSREKSALIAVPLPDITRALVFSVTGHALHRALYDLQSLWNSPSSATITTRQPNQGEIEYCPVRNIQNKVRAVLKSCVSALGSALPLHVTARVTRQTSLLRLFSLFFLVRYRNLSKVRALQPRALREASAFSLCFLEDEVYLTRRWCNGIVSGAFEPEEKVEGLKWSAPC